MEYELYLMHWGIKGQRWGVRRYQNNDGSLTPAGKVRYRDANGAWLFDHSKIDKAKEIAAKAVTPSIKAGKDKPNISPAQKIGDSVASMYDVANKAYTIKNGRPAKQMSDEELKKKINRLDLEKRYEQLAQEDIERGKVTAADILSVAKDFIIIGSVLVPLFMKDK